MDDETFLRRMAVRGRVALLADGTAVPAPVSVMDDESRAGSEFIIDLVSPVDTESGDGRTFEGGTITVRDLPIPLMWQYELNDGHKGAVIVGRIDYIEEIPEGLGNARGVFDVGPWGREAERMVRAKMLRGVSGDYSNFDARVTPADRESADETDDPLGKDGDGSVALKDDKIQVTKSRLVSATLVSKPAFEGCYIRIPGDEPPTPDEEDGIDPDDLSYEDGVIEAAVAVTASALIAGGLAETVNRLTRLEAIELELMQEEWSIQASAARERVMPHRLSREREQARARVAALRNVTASFQAGHPDDWRSHKAKGQPRDTNGGWLSHGSTVRWPFENKSGYHKGRVEGFDEHRGVFKVKHLKTGRVHHMPGEHLEVVKALVPYMQEPVLDGDGDYDNDTTDAVPDGTP